MLKVTEDRETPKEVYNFRVYLAAAIASFAAVLIGYDNRRNGGLDALEALFAYPIGHYLGRKTGLMISAAFFLIGAGIQMPKQGWSLDWVVLYLDSGLSEISPPAIRGRLVGMYEVAWQIGGLVGFWINYAMTRTVAPTRKQYLIPLALQFVPAGLFAVGLPFLKESPRWLITRGRNDEAFKNLQYLRKLDENHPYLLEEFNSVQASFEEEKGLVGESFWGPFKETFFVKRIFYRVCLGSSLFLLQLFADYLCVRHHAIGVQGTQTGLLSTGVFGIIKTTMCLLWSAVLIDRFGRRKLFMTGSFGGGLCLYYVAIFIKVVDPAHHPSPSGKLSGKGTSALVFFYFYTILYSPSWAGTPWVWSAEVFPSYIRSLTQALMSASNWFWTFMISRFTPQMFTAMHAYGPFFFFASMMMVSGVYVYFLIPETKGIPLEAMDRLFSHSPRKAHAAVLEELRDYNVNVDAGSADKHEKPTHLE
ncbi:general substrate transporter [Pseudohyphozyma bogoriensis]|nr:general substrate transporter [Pseudohyphozyma bogoriensis]